uniref:Gag/pol protein n=1 Tax=Ascaris lumbricoides TaxID=6252 RepID=A0A0M3I2F7_ASCLU
MLGQEKLESISTEELGKMEGCDKDYIIFADILEECVRTTEGWGKVEGPKDPRGNKESQIEQKRLKRQRSMKK